MTLFDFGDPHAIARWHAIDDRVMGGVSQSELVKASAPHVSMAVFRGTVSARNNGGFCSARATLDDLVATDVGHLSIACQNNMQWGKKTYYLNLRISGSFDGISYRTAFTPQDSLSRHDFTAIEFAPVFRGRSVTEAPPMEFALVQQLGLMIADSQFGSFELNIREISAF